MLTTTMHRARRDSRKNDELTYLIKNIYKVLLSRGMKGCYLFCRDENLRNYLKDRLNCIR